MEKETKNYQTVCDFTDDKINIGFSFKNPNNQKLIFGYGSLIFKEPNNVIISDNDYIDIIDCIVEDYSKDKKLKYLLDINFDSDPNLDPDDEYFNSIEVSYDTDFVVYNYQLLYEEYEDKLYKEISTFIGNIITYVTQKITDLSWDGSLNIIVQKSMLK